MDATEMDESFTFIQKPPVKSIEEKLSHARDMLLNRVFLGSYEERRYVPELNEYRDVVIISSAESELTTDLDAIVKELKWIHDIKWLGITGAEVECSKPGSCLWVKLKNLPFGSFWFQMKQIKYENGEIILGLKCLRQMRSQDFENIVKDAVPKSENPNNSKTLAEYSFDFDPMQKIAALCVTMNDTIQQVKPHLTWNNFFLASKFIFTLAFVLTSALLAFVKYIGEYFLKLLRELILLLNVVTPVIIQGIDCFTKLIGGIFVLIALIVRSRDAQQLQNCFKPNLRNVSYSHQDLHKLMPPPDENKLIIVPKNWRQRNQNLKEEFLTQHPFVTH